MTSISAHYAPVSELRDRWTDIFRRDPLVHLGLMTSIAAATFQGYLKDRFGGPLPYALADMAFVGAAAFWFGSLAVRRVPIRGPGAVPMVLLGVIAVPVLFLLHPGTPLVVELAGLRAWAEFPVAALIALSVIRNRGQLRAYVGLILILCAITAVYGIWQYRVGADAALGVSALAQLRHGSTVMYWVESGTVDFRAFSTFTFPAPFAGMMVFGILLAAGVALSENRTKRQRALCGLLIPLLFVGMTVSGTRAALIVLFLGLMLLGWYRGLNAKQLGLMLVLLVAFHIGTILTAGRILERYTTLVLQEGQLWSYLLQPGLIAGQALSEHPLGLGLGRTGVGVPFAIVLSMGESYFVFSDGDIGRAAVEMGFLGLALVAAIVFGIIPYIGRATQVLVATKSDDLALGVGPLLIATGALILIGSPLSTAPHGIMWWFLTGALFKLAMVDSEKRNGRWRAGTGE